MRVLVTGGAGFIGAHVVRELQRHALDVRVLDDLSTGSRENLPPDTELVVGSVTDQTLLLHSVEGVSGVIHLAAHRSVERSIETPLETDAVNTHGTLGVLEAAKTHGVKRVVCASSSSVYGGAETRPTPESAPSQPKSPYAVSKTAGEHYCRVYHELFGLETVSLRYFNVYGPWQRPDSPYAAVIPLFIAAIRSRDDVVIHGDGKQSRDFTYAEDAAAATVAALLAPSTSCAWGQAFNVAGGQPVDLLTLLEMLAEITGCQPTMIHTTPRLGDVRHTEAQISAIQEAFGHSPKFTLREGLTRTLAWFDERD